MLVVAVCSLKGGVGKTSITLGLASAALDRHIPTLVIDLDPQADATTGLDVLTAPPKDTADVLAHPKRTVVENAISASGWSPDSPGQLDLMMGSHRLAAKDALLPDGTVDEQLKAALPAALTKLPARYDLVLIDCPPNLAALTRTGLAASNRALIVSEPGLFSVAAASRALAAVEEIRSGAPHLQPLGIVINRYRQRAREQTYRVAELRSLFGPLILSPVIDERSALQQAQGAGRPIHRWPTPMGEEVADQFDRLLDRVLRSGAATRKSGPGKNDSSGKPESVHAKRSSKKSR